MSRRVFRFVIAGVVPLALCGLAAAQPSALVVTNLTDDPATGTPIVAVAPGETVRMRTRVSWQGGGQMAGITGDMLVVPLSVGGGEGVSHNRFSEYTTSSLVSLGTFTGDDLLGIDIAVTPWIFSGGFIVPPSGHSNGIDFVGFDWTAPAAPGEYEFRFQAAALAPNLRVYPTPYASPAFIEVPTTFIAATVTVIPAPAAPLLALAAAFAPRRRRPGIVAG